MQAVNTVANTHEEKSVPHDPHTPPESQDSSSLPAQTENDENLEEIDPLTDFSTLAPAVEAVLLTLDKAVSPGKLAEALGVGVERGGSKAIQKAIDSLNEQYEATGRSFRIERVAGGVRVMTLPAFADAIAKFHQARASQKLSRAALETLAVVAYKQPITRASLEAIRGVACGEVLRTLVERNMVTIVGRAEELGRPMLYGTTKHFLELFGLASVKDLPSVEEGAFASLLEAKPLDHATGETSETDHDVRADEDPVTTAMETVGTIEDEEPAR